MLQQSLRGALENNNQVTIIFIDTLNKALFIELSGVL